MDCCEWVESPDNNNSQPGALSSCCGPPAALTSPEKQEEEEVVAVAGTSPPVSVMNLDQLAKWALLTTPQPGCCPQTLLDYLVHQAGQRRFNVHFLVGQQSCCPFEDKEETQSPPPTIDDCIRDGDARPPVPDHQSQEDEEGERAAEEEEKRVEVKLYSGKMRGLRELLVAERMNSSALQLQLTAQQSEVRRVKQQPAAAAADHHHQAPEPASRVKRLRRD